MKIALKSVLKNDLINRLNNKYAYRSVDKFPPEWKSGTKVVHFFSNILVLVQTYIIFTIFENFFLKIISPPSEIN